MLRLIALGISLLPVLALAHPGRLDANGCHNDRKHGGYHCHGGALPTPSRAPVPTRAIEPAAKPPLVQSSAPPAPEERLPKVPADAAPIRHPVDKVSAKAKAPTPPPPMPSSPVASPPPARTDPTTGDAIGAFFCMVLGIAGFAVVIFVVQKAVLRQRPRTMPHARSDGSDRGREEGLDASEHQGPHRVTESVSEKRSYEKKMEAYRYGPCSTCTIRIRPGDMIYWDTLGKTARHTEGFCAQLVTQANAKAAQEAERKEQSDRSEAFHRLLDRLSRAKTAATREKIVGEAKVEAALTAQQRLRLLLEASKADTDDTLEKVETLKSRAVKRRRLEEMLAVIRADDVPDDMQADQIALLEEALRTLDAEP
jgi:hypothetical protein